MPDVVKLQDSLGEFLREENLLRDDLINLHVLNAVHRLDSLYVMENGGKDPDKVELPIVSCTDCEVKPINLRNQKERKPFRKHEDLPDDPDL